MPPDDQQQRLRAFGDRVRAVRRDRGWSQERFAELCGLHRTYVGSVERGERNVSLLNIWAISDALGVRPAQLLDGPTVGTLPAEARVRTLHQSLENEVIPELR